MSKLILIPIFILLPIIGFVYGAVSYDPSSDPPIFIPDSDLPINETTSIYWIVTNKTNDTQHHTTLIFNPNGGFIPFTYTTVEYFLELNSTRVLTPEYENWKRCEIGTILIEKTVKYSTIFGESERIEWVIK